MTIIHPRQTKPHLSSNTSSVKALSISATARESETSQSPNSNMNVAKNPLEMDI